MVDLLDSLDPVSQRTAVTIGADNPADNPADIGADWSAFDPETIDSLLRYEPPPTPDERRMTHTRSTMEIGTSPETMRVRPRPRPGSVSEAAEGLLGIDPSYSARGTLLPVARDTDGRVVPAWPEAAIGAVEGLLMPGHLAQGGSATLEEMQRSAFEAAATIGGPATAFGRSAVGRGVATAGETFASRNAPTLLDSRFAGGRIKIVPERPIEADYPHGVPVDDTGRLTHDIDGRPLSAPYVAGRTGTTGMDAALQPEDVVAVGTRLTGQSPQVVPRSGPFLKGDLGRYRSEVNADGERVRRIFYDQSLRGEAAENVIAHELGHAIDELAGGRGGIPLSGPVDDYGVMYHMLNDPTWRRTNPKTRPGLRTTPETSGYRRPEVRAEQMAEGIRLYMQNPAYMKEHFPNAARRIREYVNGDPNLNRTIQFNEAGAPLGVDGLGVSGRPPSGLALKADDQEDDFDEDERLTWGWW